MLIPIPPRRQVPSKWVEAVCRQAADSAANEKGGREDTFCDAADAAVNRRARRANQGISPGINK